VAGGRVFCNRDSTSPELTVSADSDYKADVKRKSNKPLSAEQAPRASGKPACRNDLADLAGSWVEDPAVDRELAGFDAVDKELWE